VLLVREPTASADATQCRRRHGWYLLAVGEMIVGGVRAGCEEAPRLSSVFAPFVELLDVDQVVLRHDHAVGRDPVPRLGHQDDPKGIDVDDTGQLPIDTDAPTRQALPTHGVTWVARRPSNRRSGPRSVAFAVFMSHDLFDQSQDVASYPSRPILCLLAYIALRGAKEE
jgi:hypothetical protein